MTKIIFQLTSFRQDHKELGAIASDPDSEHMFDIDDYDEIKSVHQRILDRVCNGKQVCMHKIFGAVHAELVGCLAKSNVRVCSYGFLFNCMAVGQVSDFEDNNLKHPLVC